MLPILTWGITVVDFQRPWKGEDGRGREAVRDKHRCERHINCLPEVHGPTRGGVQTYNPGACPGRGMELRTLWSRADTVTTEPHHPWPGFIFGPTNFNFQYLL